MTPDSRWPRPQSTGPLRGQSSPSCSTGPEAGHSLVYKNGFCLSHHCPLGSGRVHRIPVMGHLTRPQEERDQRDHHQSRLPLETKADRAKVGGRGGHCVRGAATPKPMLLPEVKRGASPALESNLCSQLRHTDRKVSREEDKRLVQMSSFGGFSWSALSALTLKSQV